MISVSKLFNTVFRNLSERQREVTTARFGLGRSGEAETLAALGDRYGVTRERIRQIEASAIGAMRSVIAEDAAAAELAGRNKRHLASLGGVLKKDALLSYNKSLVEGCTENHLALFLEAAGDFSFYPENKHFSPFYYLTREDLKRATTFVNQWSACLKNKKQEVLAGKYDEELRAFLKRAELPKEHALNYLSVSKKTAENPYGDKGLAEWAEIQPKTVRDRIYLVMKKKTEPLHFKAIAGMINGAGFNARRASAPTVHNELIKDDRFVLVGRGTYALAERGYEPGTAREVIHRILRKQGALRPREIMLAVQKERFFKPNTILVNLQNKNFFKRLPDGTYKVREA